MFSKMLFYLSSLVYSLRHLAVLLKQKVANKKCDKIMTYLSFYRLVKSMKWQIFYSLTEILSFYAFLRPVDYRAARWVCRSRDGELIYPGPVPYFPGYWSWNNFYVHSPTCVDSRMVLSVTRERKCTKSGLTLRICCSQHFSQMVNVGAKWNRL